MLAGVVGVRTPVLLATLERRLLVIYRLEPEAVVHLVPAPFWPQLVNGFAVGSLTLDHVTGLRPRRLPSAAGFASENAAHRIAVEWLQNGRTATGTFVLVRHTSSRRIAALGDRFFPGQRERAGFEVEDRGPNLRVACHSRDGATVIDAEVGEGGFTSELFASPEDVWRFCLRGAMTASLRQRGGVLDWIDERARGGVVRSASIERISSSVFPAAIGSPDSAIVARDVTVEWRAVPVPR